MANLSNKNNKSVINDERFASFYQKSYVGDNV